jgi:hypothetical protein
VRRLVTVTAGIVLGFAALVFLAWLAAVYPVDHVCPGFGSEFTDFLLGREHLVDWGTVECSLG